MESGEDAGIYGIAHIISDVYNTPGDEFGERKTDLIVEWPLTEEPLLKEWAMRSSAARASRLLSGAR